MLARASPPRAKRARGAGGGPRPQRSLTAAVPPGAVLQSAAAPGPSPPRAGAGSLLAGDPRWGCPGGRRGAEPAPPDLRQDLERCAVSPAKPASAGSNHLTSPSLASPSLTQDCGRWPVPPRGSARAGQCELRGRRAAGGYGLSLEGWPGCWWDRKALGPSGDCSEEGRWICFAKGVGFLAVGAYCKRRFPWRVVVVIKG